VGTSDDGWKQVIAAQERELAALHEHITVLHRIVHQVIIRRPTERQTLEQMQAEIERLRVCVDRVSAHNAVAETPEAKPEGVPLFPNPFSACR